MVHFATTLCLHSDRLHTIYIMIAVRPEQLLHVHHWRITAIPNHPQPDYLCNNLRTKKTSLYLRLLGFTGQSCNRMQHIWMTNDILRDFSSWSRHQMETFSALLPFVRGIHRKKFPVNSPHNSPHKGQWRGTLMICFICAWINNGEAADLRRHHAQYDVTVMLSPIADRFCCCFHLNTITFFACLGISNSKMIQSRTILSL